MKILVMILSFEDNDGIYDKLENTIRETWYNDSIDDVETIFYYGNSDREYIIDDKLYLNELEGIDNLGNKVLAAFRFILDNKDFDYIFKMNSSSYLNKKLLKEIAIKKPKRNVYSGVIGNHSGIPFISGSGTLMSRDVVQLLVEESNIWDHNYIEDVSIGKIIMNHKNIELTFLERIDIINGPDYNLLNIKSHHYRCKNDNRENDLIILKELYKIHNNKNDCNSNK